MYLGYENIVKEYGVYQLVLDESERQKTCTKKTQTYFLDFEEVSTIPSLQ